MIKLIVDFSEEIGFWYFVVEVDGETVCFRPGFREKAEAARVGDLWIQENLGASREFKSSEN
jgi:hypothetical protein